jgi:hypothetical protein
MLLTRGSGSIWTFLVQKVALFEPDLEIWNRSKRKKINAMVFEHAKCG